MTDITRWTDRIESPAVFIVAEFYQTQFGLIFHWQTETASLRVMVVEFDR